MSLGAKQSRGVARLQAAIHGAAVTQGSATLESVSQGWLWILSALKSLLETDGPLPASLA